MRDRYYNAGIVIACQGTQESEIRTTVYGEIRSRSGANLRYTKNDAIGVYKGWCKSSRHLPEEAIIYLENPLKSEVENAFKTVCDLLSNYPYEQTGIDFYFAGHGNHESGALVLNDDVITAKQLLQNVSMSTDAREGKRGLSLMLDSCYAGSFLIDAVVEIESEGYAVKIDDAEVASMHDEKSWELSFLEHGAFTFSLLYQGNSYVSGTELAKAIEQNDAKALAKFLQGLVALSASAVAFLTQGRQHSIRCHRGYRFDIVGIGGFSLFDVGVSSTKQSMIYQFEKIRSTFWEENKIIKNKLTN